MKFFYLLLLIAPGLCPPPASRKLWTTLTCSVNVFYDESAIEFANLNRNVPMVQMADQIVDVANKIFQNQQNVFSLSPLMRANLKLAIEKKEKIQEELEFADTMTSKEFIGSYGQFQWFDGVCMNVIVTGTRWTDNRAGVSFSPLREGTKWTRMACDPTKTSIEFESVNYLVSGNLVAISLREIYEVTRSVGGVTNNLAGRVLSHELLHSFGSRHDESQEKEECIRKEDKFLMTKEPNGKFWRNSDDDILFSGCTQKTVEWFLNYVRKTHPNCLKQTNDEQHHDELR